MVPFVVAFLLSISASAGEGHPHLKQEVEAPAGPKDYGKGVDPAKKSVSLSEALSGALDQEVVIKAKIGNVCQMAGCWITIEDGDAHARVTYNHAFAIPKKAGKRDALVQGKLFKKEMSVAEARHYAQDSGMSAAEAKKKIREPQISYWVEASGIRLL